MHLASASFHLIFNIISSKTITYFILIFTLITKITKCNEINKYTNETTNIIGLKSDPDPRIMQFEDEFKAFMTCSLSPPIYLCRNCPEFMIKLQKTYHSLTQSSDDLKISPDFPQVDTNVLVLITSFYTSAEKIWTKIGKCNSKFNFNYNNNFVCLLIFHLLFNLSFRVQQFRHRKILSSSRQFG